MLSLNQSPGEFESKDEGSGATGKPGRLPEGGSLDLGFEGGRGGTTPVSCNTSAWAGCSDEPFMGASTQHLLSPNSDPVRQQSLCPSYREGT